MNERFVLGARTLSEALSRVRQTAAPGRRFLLTSGGALAPVELTYRTLLDQVARTMTLFQSAGLSVGSRVLIVTTDERSAVTLLLACLESGLTAVLGDAMAKPLEARSLVEAARPSMAFIDGDRRSAWPLEGVAHVMPVEDRPAGGSLFKKLLGRSRTAEPMAPSFPAVLATCEAGESRRDLPDELDAFVMFTSGSTARPSGVRITRGNVLAHAQTFARQLGWGFDCQILNVLPLHHVDGLMQGIVFPWLTGASALRPGRFSLPALPDLLDVLHRERATHLVAVPTMLALIADHAEETSFRSPDFRFVVSTAAFLRESLWTGFQERFGVKVVNLYGLTETVAAGCFCGPDDETSRMGTVGKAVDCAVRVVDESGEILGGSQEGELQVRGAHVTPGYLDPATTSAAFTADGWFRTGDIATIDADGFVRIVGRRKNLVISGGLNIQPEEVSEFLMAVPGVQDAVAFGLPDETFGEILVACVVARSGVTLDSTAVVEACRSGLSAHKVPVDVKLLPALPKGAAGKVSVPQARALYLAARQERRSNVSEDIRESLYTLAAETLRVPRRSLTAHSAPGDTAGWDSFAHLTFVIRLEASFGIRLTAKQVMEIRCLGDAERVVRETLGR